MILFVSRIRKISFSRSALAIMSLIIFLWILRSLPWDVLASYSQDRQAFYLLDIRYNGSWILPHNPEPRVPATKPPLLAWISTILSYVLDINAFPLRLPSLFASIGCLILIYLFTKKIFGERSALFAMLAFGLNPLYMRISTLVRTDALLTFFVTAYSLLVLLACHEDRRFSRKENFVFWFAISLLFLLKGPAFLPFFVATLIFPFIFKTDVVRHIDFRWFWVPLLIYGGWLYSAWIVGGADFIEVAIKGDVLGRIATDDEGRKQSIYFYVMYMTNNLSPWFLIFLALLFSGRRWTEIKGNPLLAALFCWSLGSLLIMSLIPSKRMDRMIAAWPAFAILIGIYLASDTRSMGNRFSEFLFGVFGWTGAVGSVMVFASVLSKGTIELPVLHIREAMGVIPSYLYVISGSALLSAIVFIAGYVTKRLPSDSPFYCGLALFLCFSLYSIQQATKPADLIEAVYCRFGRDVQKYLRENNFEGRVVLGAGDRQMFWYAKVFEPKVDRELLSNDQNIAYISYSSESQFLAEKGLIPVMESKPLPEFKDSKVFALYLPVSNTYASFSRSEDMNY